MLVFNDTATKTGIIQGIERTLFGVDGFGKISGNTALMAAFTADINLALVRATLLIDQAAGTWQFDDTNQTDYPIIKTNIVSGQRDYTFLVDGSNNLILDIYKVAILRSSDATQYYDIRPVDVQSDSDAVRRFDDTAYTGVPYDYDKTANGITFGTLPNYNATNGLLVYINREQTYFLTTDTTKKPGFAGLFHEYLILRPAYQYARANGMSLAGGVLRNGSMTGLLHEVSAMEQDMKAYYGSREKDSPDRITTKPARAFR